ncbi:MAG: MerR family transcriptional regulator [Deltaproteobacteria bacterium]|nr:MerR family transcriptional regulator [Deltaproteobacteria bacterium]MBW1915928.1 MerR family transcriptional regulator [Deltaproteobacteria bacterium]
MKIPDDKRYFRIGEVSRIIGVEPSVLRYWESEFPQIRPPRADSNQRTYQRKDLDIILEIKRLLYDEKLTINGARQKLKKQTSSIPSMEDTLRKLKAELKDIAEFLS